MYGWERIGRQGKRMKARPVGSRTRARPRKTYMYVIEEIERKNGTGVTELMKIAGDRRVWRRWIEAVST